MKISKKEALKEIKSLVQKVEKLSKKKVVFKENGNDTYNQDSAIRDFEELKKQLMNVCRNFSRHLEIDLVHRALKETIKEYTDY